MRILGVDSSGMTASAALVTDGVLAGEYTVNHKKTHSQTLLPMIAELMKMVETDINTVDAIAVAAGPGSFTGLRIGAATVKGLGLATGCSIIPVPTLEGLAFNMWGSGDFICPIMDARRNQVYTGLYIITENTADKTFDTASESGSNNVISAQKIMVKKIIDQTACDIHELTGQINSIVSPDDAGFSDVIKRVTFLGDGVPVFKDVITEELTVPYRFAPANLSLQRASSVALLGEIYYNQGRAMSADSFAPVYLRKSQAEREREAAEKQNGSR